jgi:ATP-dependent DNA helicase RecQ
MTSTMTGIDRATLRQRAEEHLRALAGPHTRLREDQWVAIEALVADRRRALVVQRTGWGKSAVYFIATALLRARGAGPTVIVSPLLALMRNQIAAAEKAGIHAATINSTNVDDWTQTYAAVNRGEIDVLLLSPERLNNPDFRDSVMPHLAATCGMLVVDEAHCISDWGHDFRPDFRRLRTLLPELPDGIPVLATTATANTRVVDDITDVLGLGRQTLDRHTVDRQTLDGGAPVSGALATPDSDDVLVLRGGLDRDSLHLGVLDLPSTAHRLAWLADHLDELPGSGIIYTLTVAGSQEVADYLAERGFTVTAYSGKTEQTERLAAEDDLINNRVKALVATSALGMGFDKPDLGFVIHFGAPASPIAYYQQVGRAGRRVDDAKVILLPGSEDQAIWDYFASVGFPREDQVRTALDVLGAHRGPMSTTALETRIELSRSRLETMLKVLDVDGAARRVKGGWVATGQPWTYDGDRYAKVAEVRHDEQRAMRHYISTSACRMRFLRQQLDDVDAAECGRCDNCGGLKIPTNTTEQTVSAAAATLRRPGVTVDARRQWPAGMPGLGVDLRGKILGGQLAEQGRALARYTDLGFGQRVRQVLTDGAADGEAPADLVAAAVQVLAGWRWAERPSAVVHIGSRRRPVLIADLAGRISTIGRLVDLGGIAHLGPSAAGRSNSAHRLRAVWQSYSLPAGLVEQLTGPRSGACVLLVDDYTDTGWTLTVVARLLRQAGAGAVYPFVLGVAG